MKKSLLVLLLVSCLMVQSQVAKAEDYWSVGGYYEKGMEYMNSSQYTSAIAEFKKALRVSPFEASSKISLVNAYLARASYYNNKMSDYTKAANDVRSALFYLKYYDVATADQLTSQAITTAEKNLDLILSYSNFNKSAQNRFNTAKTLRAQGDFAASGYEFMKAMSDNSFRKDCLIALGDIYNVLGLDHNSVAYYEQAVEMDDTDSSLHLKLARGYEKIGNANEATKEYNLALSRSEENDDILSSLLNIWQKKVEENPNDPESHANLGAIYQKSEDYPKALEQYQIAEKLNPSNATTRLNMGTLYQLQKEYDKAITSYDSVLTLYPNNSLAHFYKAQCLLAKADKQNALVEYKLAMKADPKNQDIKAEMYDVLKDTMTPSEILAYLYSDLKGTASSASVYYKFAFELHKAGKLKDSIPFYEETIKLDPNFTEAYINLSQVHKQLNDLPSAKNVLNSAKTRFPEDKTILNQYNSLIAEDSFNLYNKASELFTKSQYQEAIDTYSQINPATSEALVGIAASYQAMDNSQKAVEYYKKALAIDANNADILYYLAVSLSNLDDNANAKVYLKKSLAITPTKKESKELLAYIIAQENTVLLDKTLDLYDKQSYDLALKTVNTIISQDAKNSTAFYYRGLIYDAQKKYVPAIADYKKAIALTPTMDVAYYSLAVDYDMTANYIEAVRNYKKFLTMNKTEDDYTKYAKRRLVDLKAYDK